MRIIKKESEKVNTTINVCPLTPIHNFSQVSAAAESFHRSTRNNNRERQTRRKMCL